MKTKVTPFTFRSIGKFHCDWHFELNDKGKYWDWLWLDGWTERKAFLRSFVKRIEISKGQVTVNYTLPLPPDGRVTESVGVLPIVTFGGSKMTFPQ
jgi:hypothetical protein